MTVRIVLFILNAGTDETKRADAAAKEIGETVDVCLSRVGSFIGTSYGVDYLKVE